MGRDALTHSTHPNDPADARNTFVHYVFVMFATPTKTGRWGWHDDAARVGRSDVPRARELRVWLVGELVDVGPARRGLGGVISPGTQNEAKCSRAATGDLGELASAAPEDAQRTLTRRVQLAPHPPINHAR